MIPVRLEIQNFLAYCTPQPIRYEGIHLACLTGANGAGKSSMLDAITWALWGRARGKRDDDLIHLGEQHAMVQLDFEHEQQKYRVIRRRSRTGRVGSGSVDFFIFDSATGNLTEISEVSAKDTQRRINDLLRLDYETFVHSAFLQQGQADAFTVQPPAKRKQILANILGLQIWEAYEERVKETVKQIKEELQRLEVLISECDETLRTEGQVRRELQTTQAQHAEAIAKLQVAEELLAQVQDAPLTWKSTQEMRRTAHQRVYELNQDLNQSKQLANRYQQEWAQFQDILQHKGDIESGYQKLQEARQADQTLSLRFSQLYDIEQLISNAQRELATAQANLQQQISVMQAQIDALEATIQRVDAGALEQIHAQIGALDELIAERDHLQERMNALAQSGGEFKANNDTLKNQMDELKERMDTLKDVEGSLCPLCGGQLTPEHRERLLGELQAEGTARGDTFRANRQRMTEIADEQKQLRESVQQINGELSALSTLQKRAGELQSQVADAERAQSELDDARHKLEGLQAELAHGLYAPTVRQRLAELEAERDGVGYDKAQHEEQRTNLQALSVYERQQSALRLAESSLPRLEESLQHERERQHRLQETLTQDENRLREIDQQLATLEAELRVYEERKDRVMRLRTEERNAENRVTSVQQQLQAIDAKRKRKQQLEERRSLRSEEYSLHDQLKEAFGKNGVPAMIIETAIPELEAIANELLFRMTAGRMTLKLSTQREKVTGGTSETLQIDIMDELGQRNYEMFSGGEAFRINFALRIALSKLLARRAGAHLQTLFIDEGFGTQDNEGRDRLIEAINAIKDDFDMILVITHIEELKDAFPVHIHIQKTAQGSIVEIL